MQLPIADWRLPIGDWRLPIADCRLPIADCQLIESLSIVNLQSSIFNAIHRLLKYLSSSSSVIDSTTGRP
jgi:hypothetical protein